MKATKQKASKLLKRVIKIWSNNVHRRKIISILKDDEDDDIFADDLDWLVIRFENLRPSVYIKLQRYIDKVDKIKHADSDTERLICNDDTDTMEYGCQGGLI